MPGRSKLNNPTPSAPPRSSIRTVMCRCLACTNQYLYAPLTLIQPDKGKKPRKVQYGETTFVVIDATVRMATA